MQLKRLYPGLVCASCRERVSHIPELLEVAHIQPPPEHFDGRALRADDVASDHALDELEVHRAPQDEPLVPIDQAFGDLKHVLDAMTLAIVRGRLSWRRRERSA